MAPDKLRIEVVYSPAPDQITQIHLLLPAGADVAQALTQSGLLHQHPSLQTTPLSVGVWGQKSSLQTKLRDQDRVEIYRPLRIDPKQARRLRQQSSG